MAQMIRKQFYIEKRQQAVLKRLAKARGVSEAEVVRQAIDEHAGGTNHATFKPDPEAWEREKAFILQLRAQGPIPNQPRDWKREDAYEERLARLERHARHTD